MKNLHKLMVWQEGKPTLAPVGDSREEYHVEHFEDQTQASAPAAAGDIDPESLI